MMLKLLLAGALVLTTTSSMAVAQGYVSPEVAELCRDRWGNDYSMRVVCQRNQMEAKEKLEQQPYTCTMVKAMAKMAFDNRQKGMDYDKVSEMATYKKVRQLGMSAVVSDLVFRAYQIPITKDKGKRFRAGLKFELEALNRCLNR